MQIFLKICIAAKKDNLTLNEEKCVFSTEIVDLLAYYISHRLLQPDPHCSAPLLNLPPPRDLKSVKIIAGIFSHYANWIQTFLEKIKVLNSVTKYPLNQHEIDILESMKQQLPKSAMQPIDENIPFFCTN